MIFQSFVMKNLLLIKSTRNREVCISIILFIMPQILNYIHIKWIIGINFSFTAPENSFPLTTLMFIYNNTSELRVDNIRFVFWNSFTFGMFPDTLGYQWQFFVNWWFSSVWGMIRKYLWRGYLTGMDIKDDMNKETNYVFSKVVQLK